MAIERVNSVFDVPELKQEFDFFLKGMESNQAAIVGLYKTIEGYKGANFKTLTAETEKLTVAVTENAASLSKAEAAEKKYQEAMARSTMETVQFAKTNVNLQKTYQDMSGSVEKNIQLQIRYKKEMEALKQQQKDLSSAMVQGGADAEKLAAKQIEVVKAIEQNKAASAELGRTIRLQVKEQIAAGGSLDEMRAQYDRLYQVMRGLSDSDRGSAIGAQLSQDLEKLKNDINEIQKSAGDFSANVGRYKGSLAEPFKVLADELVKIRGQLANMDQGSAGFDELIKQEKMLATLTEGLNKEFSSTTMEVRALQKAAVTLGVEFGNNTEVFQKFKDQVGGAVDAVGDIQGQIKLAASDTRALDGMIGAAEGLAGAYSVAEGSAALFGGASEELMQTMVKLQAVMSILQGLQAIRNAMQKESAAMDFLQTARTKALTIAQGAYAAVVGTSTGAMKIFKLALASTGIGLIVLALGYLITNFDKVKEAVYRFVPGLAMVGKWVGALVDGFTDFIGVTDEASRAMDRLREKSAKSLKDAEKYMELNAHKYDEHTNRKLQADLDYKKRKDEILNDEAISDSEKNSYIVAAAEKRNMEIIAADKERNDEITKQNQEAADKANKIAEDAAKKRAEIAAREAQALYDISQMVIKADSDSLKKMADSEETSNGVRFAALARWMETEAKLIENEKNYLLKNDELTKTEREKIRIEAELKMAKIIEDGFTIRKSITAKNAETEKQDMEAMLADLLSASENAANNASAKATTASDLIFGKNDEEYTQKLTLLAKRLKDRNITIEQYESEKEELDIEFASRELSRQIVLAQQIISIRKHNGQDIAKEQEELNKLMQQLAQKEVDTVKKTEDEKEKIRKEKLEKLAGKMQRVGEIINNSLAAGAELASIGLDKQKVAVENLETEQQKAYENEVSRIANSTATEAEKADKLKILEAERMAQKEANERKQRKIETERAKWQKAQDISSIITSTALAVVKTLAQGGPFAVALAVAVGALGAAQLARAIAAPLPKFEHGTDSAPGGFAITDEKGAEMYIEPGGKTYLGSDQGPVMRYLKPGTKVIPHNEVNQAMQAAMMANTARQLQAMNGYENERESRVLDEIKEAIMMQTDATIREMRRSKKQTKLVNNIDLGWGSYIQQKTFN